MEGKQEGPGAGRVEGAEHGRPDQTKIRGRGRQGQTERHNRREREREREMAPLTDG